MSTWVELETRRLRELAQRRARILKLSVIDTALANPMTAVVCHRAVTLSLAATRHLATRA